ncbi:MAG: PAS domain S-box protein [Bryobacterales bacterium]|nr:PAS domain S-box protein [Bryobacterales bacterium]
MTTSPPDPRNALPTATRAQSAAWLPLPFFLVLITLLRLLEQPASYGSPALLFSLNFVFSALTSLIVVILISRSFLTRGSPGLLLLGCGVLIWAAVTLVSVAVNPNDINSNVTIYNLGAWLAGACHLTGAILSLRVNLSWHARGTLLASSYVAAIGLFALIIYACTVQWTPVFFVQGRGGTPLRQAVLASTSGMFALTAIVLRAGYAGRPTSFAHWYAIAAALIATGLFGALLQSNFGSALNWAARAAQYTGGVYMLIAAAVSVRESQAWEVSITTALTQARHRFDSIFHLAVDGIAVHRLSFEYWHGPFLEVNPALCDLLGYSAAELCAPLPPLLTPAESRTTSLGDLTPGATLRRELTLVRKDGTRLTADVNTRVFGDREATLAISIIRDISARKQMEDQLRELAQRLTYHVDNSPLAVIEWGPDMRLTRWSAGAERVFGWAAEEVLGKRMEDFRWIHAGDFPHVRAVSENLQAGHVQGFSANRNYRKDGSIAHCEWYNSCLLDEAGNLRSILSLVLDVTARNEAEAALRRSNTDLEQFAYAVSHDLQEPLRAVSIFTDLLQQRHRPALDASGRDYLDRVVTGARRMHRLLGGLRAYLQLTGASPAASALTRAAVTDSQVVLADVLAALDPVIQREHATVIVKGPLPACAVPAIHLEQLLQNLLSNALKFRAPQRQPEITIAAEPAGNLTVFAIHDNGIGIEPQYTSQIFGIFKRLHTQERFEGSGIGLAICHKIVERHGGAIWVDSTVGSGSTFRFTLPAAGQPRSQSAGL